MTVPKKGLRKIVVEGKTFYWNQESLAVTDENRKYLGTAFEALEYPTSNTKIVVGDNFEDDPLDYVKVNDRWTFDGIHAHPVQIARWIKVNVIDR